MVLSKGKLFDQLPDNIPITLVIRGQSGFGKTFLSNVINGKDRTYFADTHATNSTVETLQLIGNKNFKKTPTWDDVVVFTNSIIKHKDPPGTIVLDTGSYMNNMGMMKYKADHGTQPYKYTWQHVWKYFRDWMASVINAGFDLVITVQMTQKRDGEGTIIEGSWKPHEWKSLLYETTATIELVKGLEIGEKIYLEDYKFIKIIKTRFMDVGHMKPYIVGEPTKENILSQLKEKWEGDDLSLLREFQMDVASKGDNATLREKKFLREIEKVIEELEAME